MITRGKYLFTSYKRRMKKYEEVPSVVNKFIKLVENQTNKKVKILRTDKGKEYVNANLRSILEQSGIKHETSIAYNPQQNGRAERVNRVLLEKSRCMLVGAKLPKQYWAEAVSTAAYLSNRSPKRCLGGKTPEELWTGTKPDLSALRVFGCKAVVYIPEHKRLKMDPSAKPVIMLGYCESQHGYRLWSHQEQKVKARDVKFFEEDKSQHENRILTSIR